MGKKAVDRLAGAFQICGLSQGKHPKNLIMNSILKRLHSLSRIVALGAATSAYGLTIVPTFDSSIQNDPNSGDMMAAINTAIQVLENSIADKVTVNIKFVNDPKENLGSSLTSTGVYSYPAYLAKLKSRSTSVMDAKAISVLTDAGSDPVLGGGQIRLASPLARLLGLEKSLPEDGFDSVVSLNMKNMNLIRPPGDPEKYDLQATAEHEIDEVLGFSSSLPETDVISPIDLFRFDAVGNRTFATNAPNAYFSVDGKGLLARFNQDPTGDFSDWWSPQGEWWSPPGSTPKPQVQDAFGTGGSSENLGPNELAALDLIGWTLVGSASEAAPSISIVESGAGQITISWSESGSGFVLQARSDAAEGTWTDATTGSANPAVLQTSAGRQFYRLYKP